jgi:AraC-like DNA-binding protein
MRRGDREEVAEVSVPAYELVQVDTVASPEGDRFDRWRDHVRDNHGGLGFSGADASSFAGSTVVQRAGDLQLVEFWSDQIRYDRTARAARSDADATVRVLVPRSGQFRVESGDDRLQLGPGAATVVSMATPFSISHDDGARAWVLSTPESWWSRTVDLRRSHVLDLGSGLGAMARAMTARVSVDRATWSTADFLDAAEGIAQLLVRCAASTSASDASDVARAAADLVRTQSDDPTLTPASLAARLGWSLRHVQAVTRDLGTTPAEMIRRERLTRARARLRDPRWRDRGVAQIAHASGFGSVSAFNESFREVYGRTPRQVRLDPSSD